eukprot:m.120269 g.120269  ORF g.120269 m.120269 type:complete len:118 (+) comp14550_c0_seq1:147-500(+)
MAERPLNFGQFCRVRVTVGDGDHMDCVALLTAAEREILENHVGEEQEGGCCEQRKCYFCVSNQKIVFVALEQHCFTEINRNIVERWLALLYVGSDDEYGASEEMDVAAASHEHTQAA